MIIFIIPYASYYSRKSLDMRYQTYDPPKQEMFSNKYMLSVDEAYYSKFRRKYSALCLRCFPSSYPYVSNP